jgi:hypothetical protein
MLLAKSGHTHHLHQPLRLTVFSGLHPGPTAVRCTSHQASNEASRRSPLSHLAFIKPSPFAAFGQIWPHSVTHYLHQPLLLTVLSGLHPGPTAVCCTSHQASPRPPDAALSPIWPSSSPPFAAFGQIWPYSRLASATVPDCLLWAASRKRLLSGVHHIKPLRGLQTQPRPPDTALSPIWPSSSPTFAAFGQIWPYSRLASATAPDSLLWAASRTDCCPLQIT